MWSGSKIMCRFASPSIVCSPRVVRPRRVAVVRGAVERQGRCAACRRAGRWRRTARPAAARRSPARGRGERDLVAVVATRRRRARSAACPRTSRSPGSWRALTAAPTAPLSPATPDRALSNLLTSSIWRTPSFFSWSSWRVDVADVARGIVPSFNVQPNGHAGLDAHDHGQLAGVDHLAGLEGRLHDPVEALAGTAELRVDVVLHLGTCPWPAGGPSPCRRTRRIGRLSG